MNWYDIKLFQQKLMKKKVKTNSSNKAKNTLLNNDKFAIVESYKTARSNLMFAVAAKNNKFVAFTSHSQGD